MEFVTVSVVKALVPFASAGDLLTHADAQTSLPPVHPRVTFGDDDGKISGVLLPGPAG